MANLSQPAGLHHSTAKYRGEDNQPAYEHQEFPKLVYKGDKHKSVANAEEEAGAIADGFSLTPPVPKKEEE